MSAAARPKEEEELRRLSAELRYFEQTADSMQQRFNMMNAALTDLTYANMTLESLEQEKEGADLLVPIGGSGYIKAKLASTDKVIVGLGAGVSVEKTLPEAKAIVKERLDELEKSQTSVQQQLSQIAERITQGRTRMESLLSTLREGKQ